MVPTENSSTGIAPLREPTALVKQFVYVVARDSLLGPETLAAHYERVNRLYHAELDVHPELDYLGTRPEGRAKLESDHASALRCRWQGPSRESRGLKDGCTQGLSLGQAQAIPVRKKHDDLRTRRRVDNRGRVLNR